MTVGRKTVNKQEYVNESTPGNEGEDTWPGQTFRWVSDLKVPDVFRLVENC